MGAVRPEMTRLTAARSPSIETVREFWNREACGAHFISGPKDRRDFFERYRHFRYETEWHIPRLVPFASTRGLKVLEIGCGNGADGVRFALNGAEYTGIDFTEAAVTATREHFDLMGLKGDIRIGDAGALAFPDASFSMVYAYGVLHHTLDAQRSVDEIRRVLEPGGLAVVMLYNRHSFNYYARIMLWLRLRALVHCLRSRGSWRNDRATLVGGALAVRGNDARGALPAHYANFLADGFRYSRSRNFIHHATDGPACPRASAFTQREVRRMFSQFVSIRLRVVHFPLKKYLGNWFPMIIEQHLSSALGWYLLVFATR